VEATPALSNYEALGGEVGYAAGDKDYCADVCVQLKTMADEDVPPSKCPPPSLLVEVMSNSNLSSAGKDELTKKLKDSLRAGTKMAWVIYHKAAPFDRAVEGVQQFKSEEEVNLKVWPITDKNVELDDGIGLSKKIKVGDIFP
jgi:Uma2 family endonuclease